MPGSWEAKGKDARHAKKSFSFMSLSIKIQLKQGPADGHRLYCRTKLANKAA
jgi:hypothetical protein